MKKPVIIEESEKLRILNLHIKNGYKSIISEQAPDTGRDRLGLNRGETDPRIKDTLAQFSKEKPKVSVDSLLPAKKPTTFKEIQNFQKYVLNVIKDDKILGGYGADGKWGKRTSKAWDEYNESYSNYLKSNKIETETNTSGKVNKGPIDRYDYKKEGDSYYYKLKGTEKWALATNPLMINHIKKYKITDKSKISNEKLINDVNCIAVTTETCSKIKPNKDTFIGNVENIGCTKWAIKCLKQYDETLASGDAWGIFRTYKSGAKYNMFTNGEIDWDNLREKTKKLKINYSLCKHHSKTGKGLDKTESKVPNFIVGMYPESSSVNLSSLQLGDIVGMYWSGSDNKGKAFCQRAIGDDNGVYSPMGLDEKGEFAKKDPFTFNTHAGFVGAIKDGEPIIFHEVNGSFYATPAKFLLNKSGKGMITWVTSDPDVNQSFVNNKKQEEAKSWFQKIKDSIANYSGKSGPTQSDI